MLTSQAAYAGYIHRQPKTNWTSASQLKRQLTEVDFDSETPIAAGGIPVISDGKTGYIDTSDNHVAIFGASGFKKSLVIFMELICTLALANENMFVTDPKGELYERTAEYLRSRGYRIRVVNFRDFNGEGYNPLHYPTMLYRSGDVDKAATVTSEVISALAAKDEVGRNIDPFWPSTAKQYLSGVIPLMYNSYPNVNAVNLMNLADYCTEETSSRLKGFTQSCTVHNAAMTNLRAVLSESERTRMSTLATCSSFIQPFIQNDKLARMICDNTFELSELTEEKTAFFIITDDTTPICNPIISVMISQLQTLLVDKAFHSPGGKLEHRVNFVLDEFCSLPVPNMAQALATHRSRNIRYYLCIQSLDLLEKQYSHAQSILTNCATTLFLGSTEMKLLENISTRCGTTTVTHTGDAEPLISISELMTLRRSWTEKELLYLNLASGVRFCTTLPAIESYHSFSQFRHAQLPIIPHDTFYTFTFPELMSNVINDKLPPPFLKKSPVN